MSTAEPKRGRPTIVTGEPSIHVGVSLEISLHRRLRVIAQQERAELNEVIRVALREFVYDKLTYPQT